MLTKETSFPKMGTLAAYSRDSSIFPRATLQRRNVSEVGINLVSLMMDARPKHRIDVTRALQHDWMASCRAPSPKALSIISFRYVGLEVKIM